LKKHGFSQITAKKAKKRLYLRRAKVDLSGNIGADEQKNHTIRTFINAPPNAKGPAHGEAFHSFSIC